MNFFKKIRDAVEAEDRGNRMFAEVRGEKRRTERWAGSRRAGWGGGALCGERGPLNSQGLHVDSQSTGAGEGDRELVWGRLRGKWQKLKIHFAKRQP